LPAGTYSLTRSGTDDTALLGDLDISGDLTISGAGSRLSIVDAAGIDRAFDIIGSPTVALTSLAIQNGNAGLGNGGGIHQSGGSLTLTELLIADNRAA